MEKRRIQASYWLWAVLSVFSGCVAMVHAVPFETGDRVVFVGDSITHGGSYHTYVQTFYATRFPDREVACYNVGISGDTAQGGYQRAAKVGDGIWESDVRTYEPTAAVIMLGMNDVGGNQFQTSETREVLVAQNEKQLGWYRSNYATLLDNLEALGLERIALIKSCPYDQTMSNSKAVDNLLKFGLGKNDALVALGKEVIDVESANRGYPTIDFNTPLLKINEAQQKINPAYSIVGNDRVHPGTAGHMVMAYTFLKSQALEGPVASVVLDAQQGNIQTMDNCMVSKVKLHSKGIRYTYKAHSLPFPVSAYKEVAHLIPFEREFNREFLTVHGLKKGTYALKIDDRQLREISAEVLKQGINLALLEESPQMLQANEVLRLCQERARLGKDIRAIVWAVGYLSKIKDHNANDIEANRVMIVRILDGETPEGLWGTPSGYVKGLLRQYDETVLQYNDMLQELESMHAPLYDAVQPQEHRIELIRID